MSNIIQFPSNAKTPVTIANPAISEAQKILEFVGLPCQIVDITNMSAEEYDAMFPDDDLGEEFNNETCTFGDEEEAKSAWCDYLDDNPEMENWMSTKFMPRIARRQGMEIAPKDMHIIWDLFCTLKETMQLNSES